jgi:thymidylate synthase ThyX
MEVVVPRIVLAEFNTHRVFSRNSASSRAIPVEKMIKRVNEDPYIPEIWTSNQKGMQGKVIEDPELIEQARERWLIARNDAVINTQLLLEMGIHKQTTNRLLEPFMWHTIIVTSTEWSNFFHLRNHPAAHPAIRNTAEAMIKAMKDSTPEEKGEGEWHLPYIFDQDREEFPDEELTLAKIACARCARVSYLTHDGRRAPEEDLKLHDRLLAPGHMSPFEHAAQVDEKSAMAAHLSNFAFPWHQYRKMIPFEYDILSDPHRVAANQ